MQLHGIGVRHQFIEHLAAVGELLIVLALLVEQSDGLAIAAAGIGEFLLSPVQVAQVQQEHTFLYATAGGTLVALLVGIDGMEGIALAQVDVADGVVYLVQILLVVV